MSNMAAFAEGFVNRSRETSRKRRELAQAWQEYRTANPHATLEDMQHYIDSMSDGSSYLRGGMPSGEVLNNIAKENADRKSKADATAALAHARDKRETQKLLDAEVDRYLLLHDDPDKAREAYFADYGESVGGLDLTGTFTNQRLDRLKAQRGLEMWPEAVKILEATDGSTSAVDLAARLGVPEQVAEDWVLRFQKDKSKETLKEMQLNYDKVLGIVERAAETGVNVTDTVARAFGIDPSLVDQNFIDGIIADVNDRKKRAAEDRQREIEKEHKAEFGAAEAKLESMIPRLTQAMANFDPASVRANLQRIYDSMSPEAQKLAGPNWVDMQFNEIKNAATVQQDRDRDTARSQLAEQMGTVPQSVLEESRAYISDISSSGKKFSNPLAHSVAMQLADLYYMDNRALAPLSYALNNASSQATDVELFAIGKAALEQAGIQKVKDRAQQQMDMVQRRAGVLNEDVTFNDWYADRRSSLTDFQNEYRSAIASIGANGKGPEAKLALLESIREALLADADAFKQEIEADGQNYTRVLTVGTDPWDDVRERQLVYNVDARVAVLDRQITQLEQHQKATLHARQTQVYSGRGSPAAYMPPAPPPAPTPTTGFGRDVQGALNSVDFALGYRTFRAMHRYGSGLEAKALNYFAGGQDQEILEHDYIDKVMGTEGVRDYFSENPQEWAKFTKGPLAYLRNVIDPQFREIINKRLGGQYQP